jgi:excisionase family DNA binding protein
MTNSILIDGKEYISSDRAAKLVGYTKDYVGQLARAGKIKSKRIGRSWYIEEESINKHKLSVHYILTKPKKSYIKTPPTLSTPPISATSTVEKTYKNEDISPKMSAYNGEVRDYTNQKNSDHLSKGISYNAEEGVDLFPRLHEKKHDALLHSDIRYEKVSASEATYAPKNTANVQQNSVHHAHVKEVSIRTNSPKRNSLRVSNIPYRSARASYENTRFSDKTPRIDGIITAPRNRTERHLTPISRPPVQIQKKRRDYEVHEASVRKPHTQTNKETSKIIPVIGGIVLFTIFVVVYIFISLD